MRVRNKVTQTQGNSSSFNTSAAWEMIVYYSDDSCSSEFINEYEVLILETGEWVDMNTAFEKCLVIPDNYNTWFREPCNEMEKERGYFN